MTVHQEPALDPIERVPTLETGNTTSEPMSVIVRSNSERFLHKSLRFEGFVPESAVHGSLERGKVAQIEAIQWYSSILCLV